MPPLWDTADSSLFSPETCFPFKFYFVYSSSILLVFRLKNLTVLHSYPVPDDQQIYPEFNHFPVSTELIWSTCFLPAHHPPPLRLFSTRQTVGYFKNPNLKHVQLQVKILHGFLSSRDSLNSSA